MTNTPRVDRTLWPDFAEPLLGYARRATRPGDSAELAFRKTVFAAVLILLVPFQFVVAVIVLAYGGPSVAIPLFAAVVLVGAMLAALMRFPQTFHAQVFALMAWNQAGAYVLGTQNGGGMVGGNYNAFWALMGPIGGLLVLGPWGGLLFYTSFVIVLTALVLADPPEVRAHLSNGVVAAIVNPSLALAGLMMILGYFDHHRRRAYAELDRERARADALLDNVMPAMVSARLKSGEARITDQVPGATLLFADLVGFTHLAGRVPADELVDLLDDLFGRADVLAERHGVEKIKTIGDCYMVAAGVPAPRADHVDAIARFALDLRDAVKDERFAKHGLAFRIGVHTGPVVAGVIGRKRFLYDLWGDTVNIASRMESSGVVGGIQVTEAVATALGARFQLSERGTVEVKGKGPMSTWWLEA